MSELEELETPMAYGAGAVVDGVEWIFCSRDRMNPQGFMWWTSDDGIMTVPSARHEQFSIAGIWQAVFPQARRR